MLGVFDGNFILVLPFILFLGFFKGRLKLKDKRFF